jgi:acetyltransferase-like isoleucine patch superfamily enzyme
LVIGRNVGLSGTTIVCARSVTIEDDVYIGGGCNIYDTDFHSISPEARLARPDSTVKTAPILIKRRSFVGAHTTILKGVVIGEAAVIGAGSVLARSVPDGEIWAGNPARFVRRIEERRIEERRIEEEKI